MLLKLCILWVIVGMGNVGLHDLENVYVIKDTLYVLYVFFLSSS
jgi:hypothetical protein